MRVNALPSTAQPRLLFARLLVGVVAAGLITGTVPPLPRAGALATSTETDHAPSTAFAPRPLVSEAMPAPIDATLGVDRGLSGVSGYSSLGPAVVPQASDAPESRTEATAKRSEFTRTFANPDGSYTLEYTGSRLNYRDPAGSWQAIDLSLVPDSDGPFDLRVANNDRTARFGTGDAQAGLVHLSVADRAVGLRAFGYGAAESRRADDLLAYHGSDNLGSLTVYPTDLGFEFAIEIERSDQATSYHFALETGGLEASLAADGKTVVLRSTAATGNLTEGTERDTPQVVAMIDAPLLLTADAGGNAVGDPVSVGLVAGDSREIPDDIPTKLLASLGADEVVLSYRIDPAWLKSADRQFPVVLDPQGLFCVGNGASSYGSCTDQLTSGSFDEFIYSSEPTYHASGWTVLRLGYDSTSAGEQVSKNYGVLRDLFYMPDVALPDGAHVTAATLQAKVNTIYGNAVGQSVKGYMVKVPWGTNSVSWNDMPSGTGYDNTDYITPAATIPSAGNAIALDVTDIARAWYTRRAADWKPNVGIMLKMVNEGSAYGEARIYKGTTGTNTNRPVLYIAYTQPHIKIAIDSDAEFGNTYTPSSMVARQNALLPVTVTNSGSGFTLSATGSDKWELGYRWFDAKGADVTCWSGTCPRTSLSASLANNANQSRVVTVQTPAQPGHYTLRLDLVHVVDGETLWSSDWADPSLYFSHNKDILSAESTRWTGSSLVERTEYGIAVVSGGGQAGNELPSVGLASSGSLGINLHSRNLHFEADTGLGFDDLGTHLGLTYGYDRANTADCSGILAACGWYTNYDERFVAGGGGTYTYQDGLGSRSLVAADGTGQLASDAQVALSRRHFTILDERQLNWAALGADPSRSTNQQYVNGSSLGLSNTGGAAYALLDNPVPLTQYPIVKAAVRSSSGSGATGRPAIGFYVRNTNPRPGEQTAFFLFYTFGTADWQVGSHAHVWVNTSAAGTWALLDRNLMYDIEAAKPGIHPEDLEVIEVDIRGDGSGSSTVYFDDVRLEPQQRINLFDESQPPWTSGTANASLTTYTAANGTNSILVSPAPVSSSPNCDTCVTGIELEEQPFLSWEWKKMGGTTVAVTFQVTDDRPGSDGGSGLAEGWVTYYAGPQPPPGVPACPGSAAPCAIQVSPTLPTEWTTVTRNLLEDARALLGFYDDHPLGNNPSAPPVAPQPDGVNLKGYRLIALDGTHALFDYMRTTSTAAYVYPGVGPDLIAEYPGQSRHLFNTDGKLVQIADRDGNATTLSWVYNWASSGPDAYSLDYIRAPSDGQPLASGTAQREINVTTADTGNLIQVTFTEQLGSTSSATGRRVDFWVADANSTAAAPGNTYKAQDLVYVSPARRNSAAGCNGTRPSGCVDFDYTNAVNHSLDEVRDPRWTGATSGSNDLRLSVAYSSADPVSVSDRSKGATPQLSVISFDDQRDGSRLAKRVIWQDAPARGASRAVVMDLTPDGGLVARYARKGCVGGQCTYDSDGNGATWPTAPAYLGAELAERRRFDGLARINATYLYRCPASSTAIDGCSGTDAQVVVTRHAANAAAKVNSVIDPLGAGEVFWSQTAEQYFASMRDSRGTNPDLYRTEYAYDANHQPIHVIRPAFNRTPGYAKVVLGDYPPVAYWRLGESSGSVADASGNGWTGTVGGGSSYGAVGGLQQDGDTAIDLSGSSPSRVTSAFNLPLTAYSLEAWFKVDAAGQVAKGIVGDYSSSKGAMIWLDGAGQIAARHGSYNNQHASGIIPQVGRWYHVVQTWAGGTLSLFVDGQIVAHEPVSAAPAPGATSFEIGSYANGYTTTFLNGTVDEVAVFDTALTESQLQQHYVAGRATAAHALATKYDAEGHAIESSDNFIANGGFESGFSQWRSVGAVPYVAGVGHAYIQSGTISAEVNTTGYIRQETQVLPGQTIRLQFGARIKAAGAKASWSVSYLRTDGTWIGLTSGDYASTAWTTKAFDIVLPLDGTGQVRVLLYDSAGSGTAYFDNVLVVSSWAANTYATNGRLTDADALMPGAGGAALLKRKLGFATAATHPAIYPTSDTANYVDGTFNPSAPDEDLISTSVFDRFGRRTTVTDPSGVAHSTAYATNMTDVASTSDGVGNVTSYSYDVIGQPVTMTSPSGRLTASSYDLAGHVVSVTAPDGVIARSDYDTYNQLATTWANYVDGTPSGSGGLDDVKTTYVMDAYGYGRVYEVRADTGYSGSPDAVTRTTYDLLGGVVASTVYAAGGTSGPRTTTTYYATYSVGSGTLPGEEWTSLPTAVGSRAATPPSGSVAPDCPDYLGTKCNNLSDIDLNGHVARVAEVRHTSTGSPRITVIDRNLAGQPVRNVENFVDGAWSSGAPAEDVVSSIAYDLNGSTIQAVSCGVSCSAADMRVTRLANDDLGRPILKAVQTWNGSAWVDYSLAKTVYRANGQVERTSAPAAAGTADNALAWTKTEYDAAGRAVRTLDHYDIDGNARYLLDAFEDGNTQGWSNASSGFFTTAAAASMGLDSEYHSTGPKSGRGRLRVTTHATSANSGAWLNVSEQTFVAGRTYHVRFDLAGDSGNSLNAFFGVDQSGASYAASSAISTTGQWQTVDLEWTPATTVSSNVHLAVRKNTPGTISIYLDNVQVWDVLAADRNIPTETGYDPDGNVVASVLPPGNPGGDPLITTTAYDAAGRAVSVTVDAADGYAHLVQATSGLVSYWPLDERSGTSVADVHGTNSGTRAGAVRLAVAGGVDEARGAVRLDGSTGYATVSDAASLDLTGSFSLEFWASSDVLLDGASSTGWKGGVWKGSAYGAGWHGDIHGWRGELFSGGQAYVVDAADFPAEPGRWYQVALTYDGSSLKLYVDGELAASNAIGSKVITATASALTIGQMTNYWDGALDEVALYNAALSGTTVADHFAAGSRPEADVALTTRSVYDDLGREVLTTSPRGIRTSSAVDRLGRLSAVTANLRDGVAAAASTDDDDLRATYAYNVVGELLASCTPEAVYGADACDPLATSGAPFQSAWHYAYDAMGRLTAEVRPVNRSLSPALDSHGWVYGSAGQILSQCDYPAGGSCASASRHTDYSYDALGGATGETVYSGSGTGTPKLSWTRGYATDGSLTSTAFDGTASGQGTDTLTFAYDALGRPDQVKRGSTVLTDYAWNPTGTLASRIDGSLGSSAFSYDWANRLTSMTSPAFSGSLLYTWRNDGLLGARQWPSGSGGAADFGYDAAKRPTAMTKYGTAAGSLAQTYDRDGNVTSESRSLTGVSGDAGSATQSFTYDGANRVVLASGLTDSAAYLYDHDSNRVAAAIGSASSGYVYDRAGQLVSRVDGGSPTSFTYDAYGNQTGAAVAFNAVTTSTYDLADRLTSITPPGSSATTFSLDALGRHATRTTPSGTDTYAYLGTSEAAWQITTGSSTLSAAREPSGALAALDAAGTDGFLLADLHGNLAALVNAADTAYLSATRYDAFGQSAASYDSGGSLPNPWGFQSRLDISPDAANPLYDVGARFYAPSSGAFTQLDSYAGAPGDPLSLNRYLYAAANPWTLIDPSGHKAEMGAGSGTMTWDQYQHQVTAPLRQAAQQRREAALMSMNTFSTPSLWDQTGGQAIGVVQGLAGGAWDAGTGLVGTAYEGSWWMYHSFSPVEFALNHDAWESQWDTNIAVGQYLHDDPGAAFGAIWSGIADPIASDVRSGNIGMAAGRAAFEVGSLAVGIGALAKAAKLRFAARAVAPAARTITVDAERFGQAAAHMRDVCGASFCVTYDPAGAPLRRAANMIRSGLPVVAGVDRDEAPMAVFLESIQASVRYVDIASNRALGAYVGNQMQGLSPGDIVEFILTRQNR